MAAACAKRERRREGEKGRKSERVSEVTRDAVRGARCEVRGAKREVWETRAHRSVFGWLLPKGDASRW